MNILYVSSVCSDKKFNELISDYNVKPQQQAQKFHNLLINGLKEKSNDLYVMSILPINQAILNKIWITFDKELFNNVLYHYLICLNIPFLKQIFTFTQSLFHSIKWQYKNRKKRRVVICDGLNFSIALGTFIAAKMFRCKVVGIITDIPKYIVTYNKTKLSILEVIKSIYINLSTFLMKKYDYYVLLSENINSILNKNNKPYVVIEGLVDIKMKFKENRIEDKYHEKVIIYAGALYEQYGVKKLIKAFKKVKFTNARLWIFGSGDMEDYINKYEKKDSRIKFFGVISNSIVVDKEIRASLLINPRPTDEEYTKYSFPSKNMEYMVSGTPILTTKLPAMPQEYYDYIYLIENETVAGIKDSIENILCKTTIELHEKGFKAKDFVLNEKNNIVQAEKICNMLEKYINL